MSMELDPSSQNAHLRQRSPNLGDLVFQTTGARLTFYESHLQTSADVLVGHPTGGSVTLPVGLGKVGLSRPGMTFSAHSCSCSLPQGVTRPKSTVVHICGTVDSVFLARQLMISLLPVTLLFDVSLNESRYLENLGLRKLNEYYDVFIVSRNKPRQLSKFANSAQNLSSPFSWQSIIVRTLEKNIRALYTVHCKLMQDLLARLEVQTKADFDLGYPNFSTNQPQIYPISCKTLPDASNQAPNRMSHGTVRGAEEKQSSWPFHGELLYDRSNLPPVWTNILGSQLAPEGDCPEELVCLTGRQEIFDGSNSSWLPGVTGDTKNCRSEDNGCEDPWVDLARSGLVTPVPPRWLGNRCRWKQTPRSSNSCQYTPPPRALAAAVNDATLSRFTAQPNGDVDATSACLWTVSELTGHAPSPYLDTDIAMPKTTN